jgi:hypothetical protein
VQEVISIINFQVVVFKFAIPPQRESSPPLKPQLSYIINVWSIKFRLDVAPETEVTDSLGLAAANFHYDNFLNVFVDARTT